MQVRRNDHEWRGPPPLLSIAFAKKSANALFFRRSLWYRRERPLAGCPGEQIIHNELIHRGARVDRCRSQMREQYHIFQSDQLWGNLRFVNEHVKPRGEN